MKTKAQKDEAIHLKSHSQYMQEEPEFNPRSVTLKSIILILMTHSLQNWAKISEIILSTFHLIILASTS